MREGVRLEAARELLARALPAPRVEEVELHRAEGRFLAEAARAARPYPPAAQARADGYALPPGPPPPLPAACPIAGYGTPGLPFDRPVPEGTAVRLDRGAPIPPGSEALARVGDTALVGTERVRIEALADGGIERAGAQIRAGDAILARGTRLGPARLRLLAAAGVTAVRVLAMPRVVVVPIGDDLIAGPDGAAPREELTSEALARRLAGAGFEARVLSPVPDEEDAIRLALLRAAERGLAVATGGLGSGIRDRTRRAIRHLRIRRLAEGVALEPGGAAVLAAGRGGAIAALPGDPYEAAIAFEAIVWPALAEALGLDLPHLGGEAPTAIVLGERAGAAVRVLPVRWRPGGRTAEPLAPGLVSLACCDGLAVLAPGARAEPAGGRGRIHPPPP